MQQSLETISTPYGRFTVDMDSDRKIGNSLKSGKYHQKDLLQFLKQCITKESTVVDIGAHIGTLSVPFASWAGHVIAFEPAPVSYALLVQNAAQNNVVVDARNIGLATTAGHASLIEKNVSNAGAQTLEVGEGSITLSTLDAEVPHADVIKIDVEGMEPEILSGGGELLDRSRPIIVSEVNLSQLRSHGTSPGALEVFLKKHRYALYTLVETSAGLSLGAISNLSLLSACIAPRAWLMHTGSAPFDIVALPEEKPLSLPTLSFGRVLARVLKENMHYKIARVRARIGI